MNHTRRALTAGLALAGVLGLAGNAAAKGKHGQHDGAKLLGGKIKTNGKHVIDKKGPHTVSLDVKNGKIAGMHVKHDKKGELPVKKYKSKKKMVAQADNGFVNVGYVKVQDTYLGTTWIGFAYYDDYGDEQIYWYPYDMILDGDTGAIEYIPVY